MTKIYLTLGMMALLFPLPLSAQKNLSVQNFPTSTVSRFTENRGQVTDQNGRPRPDVKFIYSAPGMKVIFKENSFSYELYTIEKQARISEATGLPIQDYLLPDKFKEPDPVAMRSHRVDINLPGASRHPKIIAEGKSKDYSNYYLAHTPEEGVQNVHGYTKLTYSDIWPNVDLVFYARKEGELKYDIVLRPGAKQNDVQFAYEGMKGLRFEGDRLKIKTTVGETEEYMPLSYLIESRKKIDVDIKLKGNVVAFNAKKWNGKETLVIDPYISWCTYYGAGAPDTAYGITTDAMNNVFVAGETNSSQAIATIGAHKSVYGLNTDAFVVNLNDTGDRVWATYYGGDDFDHAFDIAVDFRGNVYFSGSTSSVSDIATSNTHQASFAGGISDAYLVQLDKSGHRKWGTYYGGSKGEVAKGIALDAAGNIVIVGYTLSTNDISTVGTHQTAYGGGSSDIFIAKFSNSGNRIWGTYFGGKSSDVGNGVAIDKAGNILITGYTRSSTGIATLNAFQPSFSGNFDALILQLDNSGKRMWATYCGGSQNDYGKAITIDPKGNILTTGETNSPENIATSNAHQTSLKGSLDVFVIKFNSSGTRIWGTYFGGYGDDFSSGIGTNAAGTIFIAGYTYGGLATLDGFQSYNGGGYDLFLAKFNSSCVLNWGTLYGKFFGDFANDLNINTSGQILIAGHTGSDYMSTNGAHQMQAGNGNGGTYGFDGLILKITDDLKTDIALNDIPSLPTDICAGDPLKFQIELKNNSLLPLSKIGIQLELSGPENFTLKDTFLKTIKGGSKDTLSFKTSIRLTRPGTYNLTTFQDPPDEAPSNDTIRRILIVHGIPKMSFTLRNPCLGQEIGIHNTSDSSDDSSTWFWEFGDGTTSTSYAPIKSYDSSGTYTVKLIARNAFGCTDSIIQEVLISPLPKADFIVAQQCDTFLFTNTSTIPSGIKCTWQWKFGDESFSSEKDASHSYQRPGRYYVTLIAISESGCRDSIQQTIIVDPDSSNITGPDIICLPGQKVAEYTVAGNDSSIYNWVVDGGIITSGNGTRKVTVNWTNSDSGKIHVKEIKGTGCPGATGQLKVGIDSFALKINLVTSAEQNDKVIELDWTLMNGHNLKRAIKIFREVNSSGNFIYLDSVAPSFTHYTDKKVQTDKESYRYLIETENRCGDIVRSQPHRSILLTGKPLNDSANYLSWNNYEGWNVGNYATWRSLNGGPEEVLPGQNTDLNKEAVFGLQSFEECFRVAAINDTDKSVVSWSNRLCLVSEPHLFVPNSFTPNNKDFTNDLFRVVPNHYKSFRINIFNRWGEQVFTSDSPDKMWDGTFRDSECPEDVYMYTIQLQGQKTNIFRKGTLHLIR